MAEVLLENAPKPVQDAFNKGFAAFERGNLDYAVNMLFRCIELEPGLLQARKFLRAAAIQKAKQKSGGSLTQIASTTARMPAYLAAKAMIRSGRAMQAVLAAEKLLRDDPLSRRWAMLLGEACTAADIPEAGAQTLEIIREYYPDHVPTLRLLGKIYLDMGQTKLARDCFEKVTELRPRDPAALKALKDAMALDSMSKDGWSEVAEKGGSFREMIRDSKEAQILEQEAKARKTESDTDALIEDTKAKIEAEPENINYYRALARHYTQRKRYDEALETIETASGISPGDPELAKAKSNILMQRFDHEIAELNAAGDTDAASAKEIEKAEFYFNDLQDRVKRYPNDLMLRYDWGVVLFENEYVDEAIQQFQLAQKNPKYRVLALFNLGMCFKLKKQYDMARQQFERAGEGLVQMDDTKKDVLYELGSVAELLGDKETALDHFKQIYQSDISYKDVSQKIEQAYSEGDSAE